MRVILNKMNGFLIDTFAVSVGVFFGLILQNKEVPNRAHVAFTVIGNNICKLDGRFLSGVFAWLVA